MKRTSTSFAPHFLSLLLLLSATTTLACYCFHPTVEEDFRDSDLVFSGKVTRIELIRDERQIKWGEIEIGTLEIEFEVDQTWKGTSGSKATVITEIEESACGYTFDIAESYAVFASSREVDIDEDSIALEFYYTGYCSSNQKIHNSPQARALLNQLEDLKSEDQEESKDENDNRSDDNIKSDDPA
ncbi:MAG: hypothetical protein OXG24_00635 [Gammaproteobacteria bacterium]|nr:hypothetical protein [Gammaproteobacteria bacterium]